MREATLSLPSPLCLWGQGCCPLGPWPGLSHRWLVSHPTLIFGGEWAQQVCMGWAVEPQAPLRVLLTACTCMLTCT